MFGYGGNRQYKIAIESNGNNDNNTMRGLVDTEANKKNHAATPNKSWKGPSTKQTSFTKIYTHEHNGVFHFIYDSKLFAEYMVRLCITLNSDNIYCVACM